MERKDPLYHRKYHLRQLCCDDVSPIENYDKAKAVQAFYKAGYITEEEVNELMYNNGIVQRNECTNIFIIEHSDEIFLTCCETYFIKSTKSTSILFHLSYMKDSGIIIDWLNYKCYGGKGCS